MTTLFPNPTPPRDAAPDLDATWLERLRSPDESGRRAAVSEILSAYLPNMIDVAFHILGDHEMAKDVAQDTGIRFWERHTNITVRTTLRSYLTKWTYHAALNAQRAAESSSRWTDVDASDHTEVENAALDNLVAADLKRCIDRAIARMPQRRRLVVELAVAHDAQFQEVADILDISLRTVMDHFTKASLDLRRALKQWSLDGNYWYRSNWIHWLASWRHGPDSPPPIQDLTDA